MPSRITRLVLAVALLFALALPVRPDAAVGLSPLPQGLWLAGSDGGGVRHQGSETATESENQDS